MRINTFFTLCCFTVALTCSGCDKNGTSDNNAPTSSIPSGTNLTGTLPAAIPADPTSSNYTESTEMIDPSDEDFVENSTFDPTTAVSIALDGSSATVSNPNADVTITRNGAHVEINSSASGIEYRVSGTTSDGSIKIYSSKKFKLTLNGTSITNPTGAAINIQSKKRNFLVLATGTTNTLCDGSNYTTISGEDQKATLFSEGQTILSGTGTLMLTGLYKHALCNDQYLRIRQGVTLKILSAKKDGIHVNDYFRMDGGTVSVTASSDGVEAEEGYITLNGGFLTVNAADDGLVTSYDLTASGADASITPSITINNGQLTVTTTEAKGSALNASGNLTVTGGVLTCTVKGNASKCLKADGDLSITGGYMKLATSGGTLYDATENDLSSASCIKCDGTMSFTGATLYASSTGAAGKGISTDGALTITSGKIIVITTGQQYVSGALDSSPKGIKDEGDLTINGGYISVTTSGGEGAEGVESKKTLTVNDGTLVAVCSDDCMNAATNITINGGSIFCSSSSNDAIDSNGTLTITGGLIIAIGSGTPEGGFDCDQNRFAITGGTLIGVGGSNSTPTAASCTQRSVLYNTSSSTGYLILADADGNALLTYKIPRTYNQMGLLFSSPLLQASSSYTFSTGASVTGGEEWNGYYLGGSYASATAAASFTPSSMVTTVGTSQGGMGGGGNQPHPMP